MAEQTEFSGAGSASGLQLAASEEDAGRLDGSSRWRLAAVIVALVLFAEAITFQQSMISNIVPKLAASFPQAGANVTWSITILGVAGGATMALIGKLGDLIGKRWVVLICGVLFAARVPGVRADHDLGAVHGRARALRHFAWPVGRSSTASSAT